MKITVGAIIRWSVVVIAFAVTIGVSRTLIRQRDEDLAKAKAAIEELDAVVDGLRDLERNLKELAAMHDDLEKSRKIQTEMAHALGQMETLQAISEAKKGMEDNTGE